MKLRAQQVCVEFFQETKKKWTSQKPSTPRCCTPSLHKNPPFVLVLSCEPLIHQQRMLSTPHIVGMLTPSAVPAFSHQQMCATLHVIYGPFLRWHHESIPPAAPIQFVLTEYLPTHRETPSLFKSNSPPLSFLPLNFFSFFVSFPQFV